MTSRGYRSMTADYRQRRKKVFIMVLVLAGALVPALGFYLGTPRGIRWHGHRPGCLPGYAAGAIRRQGTTKAIGR